MDTGGLHTCTNFLKAAEVLALLQNLPDLVDSKIYLDNESLGYNFSAFASSLGEAVQ